MTSISAFVLLAGLLAQAVPLVVARAVRTATAAAPTTAAPERDEDVITIVPEEPPAGSAEGSPRGDLVPADQGGVKAEIAADSAPSTLGLGNARTVLRLDARLAIDTAFDQPGEQIVELWLGGRFEVEVQIAKSLSAYAAPSFVFVSGVSKEGNDREMLYLLTPETRITYSFGPFDLRVGALIFNWGSSDLVAPNDVLNPFDYRRSFVAAANDVKIPVPAVELVARAGPLTLRGVVEPFFTPSRFFLTGWDTALVQPALMSSFNIPTLERLFGRATFDEIGDKALVSHRPADRPDNATVGARATLTLGPADLSLTAVHGWEPLPQVTVSPDLVSVTSVLSDAISNGRPFELTPEVLASLGRLQEALARHEAVFEGHYNRRDLLGFDASLTLDPFVLKLDVAYTLQRTAYTQGYRPVSNPWLTTVLGLEYAIGSQLLVDIEAYTITIFDVRSSYRLALFEPRAAPPSMIDAGGRTIALPGLAGLVRYAILEGDVRFELAGVATLTRGDVLMIPSVHYRIDDAQQAAVGGTYINGQPDGYGGAYHHNTEVFLKYQWTR